jgi:hypothetical protein
MFAAGFTFALGALAALVLVLCFGGIAVTALSEMFGALCRAIIFLGKPRRAPLFSDLSARIDRMSLRAKTWAVLALFFVVPMTLAVCLGNR